MNALVILQGYLDRMSEAVMTGDYTAYTAGVKLPFTLATAEGEMIVADEARLREGFDAYRGMLASQRATNMIRIARRAQAHRETMISGRYQTNILKDGQRLFDAFDSEIVLRQTGETWRTVWIRNGMKNASWPIHLPFLSRPGCGNIDKEDT